MMIPMQFLKVAVTWKGEFYVPSIVLISFLYVFFHYTQNNYEEETGIHLLLSPLIKIIDNMK